MKTQAHTTILETIASSNEPAKKANEIERAVIRVDPNDGSPVLIFPDSPANLGNYAACFVDCAMPHSGEVSDNWLRMTNPLSRAKDPEQFLGDLDRLIAYNSRSFVDQTAVPTLRIYFKIFRKLPPKI